MKGYDGHQAQESEGSKLPFDIRTLVIGLLRRSYLIVLCLVLAVPLAVFGAIVFGTRVYMAETVLLYRPVNAAESPSLNTQLNMVKIQANLAEVRRRLKIGSSLESLGASLLVRVQKDTTLMSITGSWGEAQGAADLANTAREVFLDQQRMIQKGQAARRIKDLEGRLSAVRNELRAADRALQQFTGQHGITDLSREAQAYIDEQTAIEIMKAQAFIDQRSVERQRQNIGRIIGDLRKKVAEEESSSGQLQGLGELNIQVTRLREAIREDKEYRANIPTLTQKELELQQARKLYSEGLISKEQMSLAETEYEKQKALTLDTEKTREWRHQAESLEQAIIPRSSGTTTSAPILRDMIMRSFEIELQSVALEQKVSNLEEAGERVKQKLGQLPRLERDYATLKREVAAREAEAASIEDLLAKASRDHESNVVDFATVTEAKAPVLPSESNRRALFIIIIVAGAAVGFLLMAIFELIDTTLKSGGELAAKFDLPVWGVLPRVRGDRLPLLGTGVAGVTGDRAAEAALLERFRAIARRIRRTAPQKGVRILVSSTGHREGRTWVASNLAACFGRQDERVLLMDANLRAESERDYQGELAAATEDQIDGRHVMTQRLRKAVAAVLRFLSGAMARLSPPLADRMNAAARRLGNTAVDLWSRVSAKGARRVGALFWADFDPRDISASAGLDYFSRGQEGRPGLGDYLKGSAASLADLAIPTGLPGVDVIPRRVTQVSPDSLGSERMSALLQQASRDYSLILIDGPPAAPYVDADVLAQHANLILFVVQSQGFGLSAVRKAVAKVDGTRKTLGFVLNGVRRAYLKAE